MEDRRWSLGIHEAIEMKEKVDVGGGTKTKSSITYQNFFPLYPKLAGMTGTAKTTEKEFQDIYNLEVIVIPTAKPLIRKDLPDFVYQTEFSKWKAVLEYAKNCFEKGQPLLIGTASVEKSEFLSDLFDLSELPHQILNAKPENVARESEIIAQAGKFQAITIATNMAGRGTDIILGGNPMFTIKKKIEELIFEKKEIKSKEIDKIIEKIFEEYSTEKDFFRLENEIQTLPFSLETCLPSLKHLHQHFYQEIFPLWEKEKTLVKELGGLFVLGTERHETRRIDNQLRGRSGRQGDPGISQFFVSLEDQLIQIFAGDTIQKWVSYLMDDKESPLESDFLTKTLENAQKKVEFYNYDLRKNIFQYDEILNNQRKEIFQARKEFFLKNFFNNFLFRSSENLFDQEWEKKEEKNDSFLKKIERSFDSYFLHSKKTICWEKEKIYQEIWISLDFKMAQSNCYQENFFKKNRLTTLLSLFDFYWTEHLERMNYIRETINWRAYGQQNPLVEYNLEAFKSFDFLLEQISSSMLYYSVNNPL
jgi:preprotein translocase subunit SecA